MTDELRWVETSPVPVRSYSPMDETPPDGRYETYESSMGVNEVLPQPASQLATVEPVMFPHLDVVPVMEDEGTLGYQIADTSLPMLPAARMETGGYMAERTLSTVHEEETYLPTLLPAAGLEAAAKRVTVQFLHQGTVHTVTLTKRPMGVVFQNESPFIVVSTSPGSEAEQQGVQPGWAFSTVDGVRVANMHCKDLVQLIAERVQGLPQDPLVTHPELHIEFDVNGRSKVLVFSKAPLGLTFNQKSARPFVVESVVPHSEGAKAGVQIGWELKRVGDFPISSDWVAVMKVLGERIALLPRY